MKSKPVIYQVFTRLFGNRCPDPVPGGSIERNGCGKLNDFTPEVLAEIARMGVNYVWYTGVIEHATRTDYSRYGIPRSNPHVVKGEAGSPYAISDYYDIDPDLAVDVEHRMEEFQALVARTHDAGMRVVIDFVPNHVARQYHSDAHPIGVKDLGADDDDSKYFAPNNNFYYIPRQLFSPEADMGQGADAYREFPAKVTGNDCFTAFPGRFDWYDTVKLNYGRDYGDGSTHYDPIPDTWIKMLNILRHWASRGVDAFRCDMVHLVPFEFWHWAIAEVKRHYPYIKFIAEIYDPALYRDFINIGGFDYLYDKVGLYDTLRGVLCSNISAATITNCWQTVEGIGQQMLNFLENHDEQRFGSRFFAGDPSHVAAPLVVSSMISSGPVMIYAGQELGEQAVDAEGYSGHDGRTTIYDYWSIPTLRRWLADGGVPSTEHLTDAERQLRDLYVRVLNLCNSEQAIAEGAFFDLMYVNYQNPTVNPHRQYLFLRTHGDETLVIGANFADQAQTLQVNIPAHAFELLGLPQGECTAVELLTADKMRKAFSPDAPFEMELQPYGAAVWKVCHKNVAAPAKAKAPAAKAAPAKASAAKPKATRSRKK